MAFLGLHYSIWAVLALYLVAMLVLGWLSKRGIHDREGFLLGNRQFGVWYMIMHAFGAGTHPGDVASVTSKTVQRGASGIWTSWMWLFATPLYWIVAPIVRRMRCLTMADYFEARFGKAASALYVVVTMVGMTIAGSSVLLATTKTVQGLMGKAAVVHRTAPAQSAPAAGPAGDEPAWKAPGVPPREADAWFIGILAVTTVVFVIYSYWGGIVAAIKTDMAQGLMIIVLSFIAIPAALNLPEVQSWSAAKATVAGAKGTAALSLFDPQYFSFWAVVMLLINAPFSMLASSVVALATFTITTVQKCDQFVSTALPLGLGILTAVVVSLLTAPPDRETVDRFFKKIYVVIGEEHKLDLPLDEAVPPDKRLCTAGGLFLVKPTRQTWVGFLVTLVICLALIGVMAALLA